MHRQLQQSSMSSPPVLISKKQLEESDSFSRRFCLIRQTHGQGTLSCISMCLSPALQSEGQKKTALWHWETEQPSGQGWSACKTILYSSSLHDRNPKLRDVVWWIYCCWATNKASNWGDDTVVFEQSPNYTRWSCVALDKIIAKFRF